MPHTFRLAGTILSVLEPETVRDCGGRFPSAHAKKSQSFSGPPPHFQNLRPLFEPSFWTIRSVAGALQSQFGWSEFGADVNGGGREGWTVGAGRRGGGGRGAKSIRRSAANKSGERMGIPLSGEREIALPVAGGPPRPLLLPRVAEVLRAPRPLPRLRPVAPPLFPKSLSSPSLSPPGPGPCPGPLLPPVFPPLCSPRHSRGSHHLQRRAARSASEYVNALRLK
jgi:hypothetical protein